MLCSPLSKLLGDLPWMLAESLCHQIREYKPFSQTLPVPFLILDLEFSVLFSGESLKTMYSSELPVKKQLGSVNLRLVH